MISDKQSRLRVYTEIGRALRAQAEMLETEWAVEDVELFEEYARRVMRFLENEEMRRK